MNKLNRITVRADTMARQLPGMIRFRVELIINCSTELGNRFEGSFRYLTVPSDQEIGISGLTYPMIQTINQYVMDGKQILIHSNTNRGYMFLAIIGMRIFRFSLSEMIRYMESEHKEMSLTDQEIQGLITIEKQLFGSNSYGNMKPTIRNEPTVDFSTVNHNSKGVVTEMTNRNSMTVPGTDDSELSPELLQQLYDDDLNAIAAASIVDSNDNSTPDVRPPIPSRTMRLIDPDPLPAAPTGPAGASFASTTGSQTESNRGFGPDQDLGPNGYMAECAFPETSRYGAYSHRNYIQYMGPEDNIRKTRNLYRYASTFGPGSSLDSAAYEDKIEKDYQMIRNIMGNKANPMTIMEMLRTGMSPEDVLNSLTLSI